MNPEQTNDVANAALVNRVRGCADQWSKSYSDAKRMLLEWSIKGYDKSILDDETLYSANLYGVASEPVSGQDLHDILRVCQVVVAFCEGKHPLFSDRKPISAIVKVATNGAFS